ncbi:MAG: alpha-mannosidase [Clostridiales bacterium]|nr:alpha-mannosidase [Clostridiales bacterium]
MKNLHLVCNAHLDPVWLWEIEEGVAETLSTFRVAADFCDNYEGFVFNHNEALLYKWVEEHDPELFERIQKLVFEKKWHIMGGWYLQPDCNMPSGESFIRQILIGKNYFIEKFGVEPTTAINFDAFGHSRGLVEIMKKANYDSYLFCRPEPDMLELPGDDFEWEGFCGSTITMHRAYNSYESHRGEADEKITSWMKLNEEKETGLVLWGIGNHGGGPSRIDYEKIKKLAEENDSWNLIHSTPEDYFEELNEKNIELPVYSGILNPRYTGCYTSQIRIKKIHRMLENELYLAEKMTAHACINGYYKYPAKVIERAFEDLLLLEFHDILPGTSIPEVEKYAMNLAGHALVEIRKQKTRAFIALCSGQETAEDGMIPIIAYNPHSYKIDGIFECEFQLPDQNKDKNIFAMPVVYRNGVRVPCQVEHESSNFNVDWRKRSVFRAELEASAINRFDVRIDMIERKPEVTLREKNGVIAFKTNDLEIEICTKSGTINKYLVDGVDYINGKGFLPLVIDDDENCWAHKEKSFRNNDGHFSVMSREEGSRFSGIVDGEIDSVRIIEDGEVRTIVEAVMKYKDSFICQRYYLPKKGTEIKITMKVYWNEKMKMLKLSVPTTLQNVVFTGQTAYGSEQLQTNGDEMVSHKWNTLSDGKNAISIINTGTYGSDCKDGELRVTLLRSPGYSAGKSDFSVRNPHIMPQDRFSPYIDQGEHDYEFYFNAGDSEKRMLCIEREALCANEKPMLLSFFPTGSGKGPVKFAEIKTEGATITAMKNGIGDNKYIVRLFNPLESEAEVIVDFPVIDKEFSCNMMSNEFNTFILDTVTGEILRADILERVIE